MSEATGNQPPLASSGRDPASFRDPTGYVFYRGGKVYRAIDEEGHRVIDSLVEVRLLQELCAEGMLVDTCLLADPTEVEELRQEHEGFTHFLEHARIRWITYPYEWSFSMLADAAILTLDLQMKLVEAGYSLKDASAYNVQFSDGKPVFIDVPSIERSPRLDIWRALGQCGQMFTFPLMLCRHCGWDLRSYFLPSIGGRNLDQVVETLGHLERWRPRWLLDVTLPQLLGRWAERRGSRSVQLDKKASTHGARAQVLMLARLRRKISKLARAYRPSGVWADYARDLPSYQSGAHEAKQDLVQRLLATCSPTTVLDLGCNTGDYSYVAAECGADVIAVDASHDAIELLYRRLRTETASITPMVVDLSSPSPAIGFRNRERRSFLDRVRADCVMALALIHHLRVNGNLSIAAVRDFLAELSTRFVLLEFVPRSDPMFARLVRFRSETFDDYSLEMCRSEFQERFLLREEATLPDSERTLLLFEQKSLS